MVKVIVAQADDYDEYYRIRSSPADIYWNGHLSKPDYESFKKIFLTRIQNAPFDNPGDGKIFLVQNEEKINVGFTQLIRREDCIEIGYSIIEEFQKRGYATEALKLTIPLAQYYFKKVIVCIRDDNTASQKVAIKNHFTRTDLYVVKNYPNTGNVKLRTYQYGINPIVSEQTM
jgi:RimJ/RimL family protein N-acetyltransferase